MEWDFLINHLLGIFYTILFFLFFSSGWVSVRVLFYWPVFQLINPVYNNIHSLIEHSWPNFKYKYCIFTCRMSTRFCWIDAYYLLKFLIFNPSFWLFSLLCLWVILKFLLDNSQIWSIYKSFSTFCYLFINYLSFFFLLYISHKTWNNSKEAG